jgi:hypothetical protein
MKITKPVGPCEEEIEFDHVPHDSSDPLVNEAQEEASEEKKSADKSIKYFCSLPAATLADSKVFDFQYGKDDDEFIKWNTMGDTEYIGKMRNNSRFQIEPNSRTRICLKSRKNLTLTSTRFSLTSFSPFNQGLRQNHRRLHSNPLSPYFAACKGDNITFHEAKLDDPRGYRRQTICLHRRRPGGRRSHTSHSHPNCPFVLL